MLDFMSFGENIGIDLGTRNGFGLYQGTGHRHSGTFRGSH